MNTFLVFCPGHFCHHHTGWNGPSNHSSPWAKQTWRYEVFILPGKSLTNRKVNGASTKSTFVSQADNAEGYFTWFIRGHPVQLKCNCSQWWPAQWWTLEELSLLPCFTLSCSPHPVPDQEGTCTQSIFSGSETAGYRSDPNSSKLIDYLARGLKKERLEDGGQDVLGNRQHG